MEFGISLISVGVAFLSVCVAVYSVRESRKSVITGTYFSEMVDAYSDYLKCVTCFVFHPGCSERDALISSLFRTSLYAPTSINDEAHELYVFLVKWAQSGQNQPLGVDGVDEKVDNLREMMHENIIDIRSMGHF